MGRPKAFLAGPDGRPLLQVAMDALRAAGVDALAIAAPDPAPFAPWSISVVCDALEGQGPLGGIEAGLREAPALLGAPAGWVVVVACDMPWLEPSLLRDLLARARAVVPRAVQAVVPRVGERAEPLHAAWHTDALPAVQTALAAGRLAVHALLRELSVEWVDLAPRPALRSVNAPEDVSW